MPLGDAHIRVTWKNLKDWARDNEVPDDALIEVSGFGIKDLDYYDAENGEPALFTLMQGERLYH